MRVQTQYSYTPSKCDWFDTPNPEQKIIQQKQEKFLAFRPIG